MTEPKTDIGRTVFAVLFMAGLLASSLWILRPFLAPMLWAVMIVVATWPLLLRLQARLAGRRSLAVAVMTLVLLLMLVLPVTMVVGTIATNAETLAGWAGMLAEIRVPPPPDWLVGVPLAGEPLTGAWQQFGALSNQELLAHARPYAEEIVGWLLEQVGTLGYVLVQFLLTVVVAAICYADGERIGRFAKHFATRIAGERGAGAVQLAARTIRGVALGVVGTALIQSALAGIGLAIAGVPFTGLLTATAFVLTVAQLPVLIVLLPAVVWAYTSGSMGMAIFLLVWTLAVSTVDNVIRPLLIKRGADLSLLLIFAGVIGGLLTLGVLGIFVGPVVLAVSWRLLQAWVDTPPPAGEPAP
ncbi:MAG: AI-2E family transporter YdiK [Gammaproteobacteria bacterium]|nr:AI-2E family transporter YdiK [Gammaproteobacteria bacterium]